MGLAQQDSAEEESLNINTTQQAVPAQENKLMIVHGALDSTSDKTVIRSKEVQAEGFDGHCSGIKRVKEVSGTLCFGQWTFPDLILTEWDLGKKEFDVILGKPWFFRCNPVIDWRTHQILNVNSSEVEPERIEGWMIKVTTKTEPQQKLHPLVARVVDEFRDVFPDKLPNTLPPPRGIEFDLTMKPDRETPAPTPVPILQGGSRFLGHVRRRSVAKGLDRALEQRLGIQHLRCSQA
ncbi:hypothetical protein AaE_011620 [Aphanomyces astaci]|uniref:Uncharacterized protein n=1 Tax=Aphanomyces astaci TaxID=112090 RepID=A0A6A4ZXH5_APHAT|nr:hypothetical protein AaE_011620 [Aphanomyces astaci]